MCVTDLDLDLPESAEDEQVSGAHRHQIGARQPGVAWGLADQDVALGDVEAAPAS
jgi:hypothetical protein